MAAALSSGCDRGIARDPQMSVVRDGLQVADQPAGERVAIGDGVRAAGEAGAPRGRLPCADIVGHVASLELVGDAGHRQAEPPMTRFTRRAR